MHPKPVLYRLVEARRISPWPVEGCTVGENYIPAQEEQYFGAIPPAVVGALDSIAA